jgi:hypothetical protein
MPFRSIATRRGRCSCLASATLVAMLAGRPANAQNLSLKFEGDPAPWLAQTTSSSGTAPAVLSGGPTGQFLRLTHLTGSNNNSFIADQRFQGADASGKGIHLVFDFRMTGNQANAEASGCCGSAADGLGAGIFFTDAGQWPAAGPFNPMSDPVLIASGPWERPRTPYSVTVGLDIFQNIDEVNLNVNAGASTADVDYANVDVAGQFGLDLNNEVWHQFQFVISPDGTASVTIVEDLYGEGVEHNVISGLATGLNMNSLPSFRFGVGGRTGAAFNRGDIDNLLVGTGPPKLARNTPPLQLEIDPRDGYARIASIVEDADVATLHAYEILSGQTPLAFAAWNAGNLAAQSAEAVGSRPPGQSWQTVNAAADQLFEAHLLGGSDVAQGEALSIGKVLAGGGGEPLLTFNYVATTDFADPDRVTIRRPWNATAAVYRQFAVSGDFNDDRAVDGRDLLAWQRGLSPTPGSAADFALWEQRFGGASAAATARVAGAAVPEPSGGLLAWLAVGPALRRLRRGAAVRC